MSPEVNLGPLAQEQLSIQQAWLRNMMPPTRDVCPVCRGPRDPQYALCYRCNGARSQSGGLLADAVVPVSYSPDDGQHYYQLRVYKSPTSPNQLALFRLAVLAMVFTQRHRPCLERAAGGRFTHVAAVPSTRARTGTHPLVGILTAIYPSLPHVGAVANTAYGNTREFARDRFYVEQFAPNAPARVLILEDLWVTGGRAQSLAYALRTAGATSVIVVALGRQINKGYQPASPILEAIRNVPFSMDRCALDDFNAP
jgi:hypothetical protein